jgi:Ca2+-transporting ATPase
MAQFDRIRIIASLPGHLRLEVPGLYRSAAAKEALERQVAAHAMVRAARANPLTARLLILFHPQMEVALLLAELGLPVGGESAPANVHAPLYAAWHARGIDEALAFFDSSAQRGLSSAEAEARLAQGANVIPQPAPVSSLQILLNQFKSLPIMLLGVSAGVSVLTGGVAEAAAIAAVLMLNGAIGFITERRAEATVASLSELIDDLVLVLRDGQARQIEAAQVVPGDIVLLAPGTRIAADLRLIATRQLQVDESALTGESFPVPKEVAPLHGTSVLAERRNMAYRGTAVATGTGSGLVVGTGRRTEVGAIDALTHAAGRPQTPVQRQLDQLGARLIASGFGLCVAVFGIGLLRGHDRLVMFKSTLALAIAAVPEGLPAVATTALARGIHRMRERNVLIRHLHAVETIGAIQTICLDKTGTLTRNVMTAVALGTLGPPIAPDAVDAAMAARLPELQRLLEVCVLCHESGPGSATETALIDLAARGGVTPALRAGYPMLTAELRAEGRNFMRTVHQRPDGGQLVAVKGSPQEVLALCGSWLGDGAAQPLDEDARARVMRQNGQMAAQQLRVLGFALAEGSAGAVDGAPLTWLGLVGLADPLRPGMEQVIARFHQAGIATIMLTGDQAATAYVIGAQLHLNNGSELNIVDAEQIAAIAPAQLSRMAAGAHIFSRVTPSDKLRIVKALQQAGQTVAMTGDGINDSPALRAADIGIAMGGGTDVALSAADIALKTDDVGALLEAVSQGRTIAANIRKSIHFLLSSNLSEILLVAGGVTTGLGQPLTPLQVLWLNLLSDVLPAIALAAEAPEPDVMARPPRDARLPIVGKDEMWRYVREGGALAGGALGAYAYGVARYGAGARARTIAFDTIVLSQMLHAMFCRSDRHRTLFDPGLRPNRQLTLAIVASLGLQAAAHAVPGLRRLLGVTPLGPADLAAIVAGALLPLLVNEQGKPAAQSRAATSAAAERSNSLPTSAEAMPPPILRPSSAPGLSA